MTVGLSGLPRTVSTIRPLPGKHSRAASTHLPAVFTLRKNQEGAQCWLPLPPLPTPPSPGIQHMTAPLT